MNFDFTITLARLESMIYAFLKNLPNIIVGIFVFIVLFLISRAVKALITRMSQRWLHTRRNVSILLGRLSQGLLTFLALLVSLSVMIPGFNAGDIVQFLGISSVAIGFAFRDILQNFLAGILILVTEPFRIGDQIVVAGHEGTVEDILTRATILRTYDGRRIVVPNANAFTTVVVVNTAYPHRRMEYDVGIGASDNIEKARALMLEAMHAVDGVLAEPRPDVLVVDISDYSVKLRARWWVQPPLFREVLEVQDRVLEAIRNKLVEHGIDLPFPTQQVLFHDQTEETDGDRARQRAGWPAGTDVAPRPRKLVDALDRLAQSLSDGRRDSSRSSEPAQQREA